MYSIKSEIFILFSYDMYRVLFGAKTSNELIRVGNFRIYITVFTYIGVTYDIGIKMLVFTHDNIRYYMKTKKSIHSYTYRVNDTLLLYYKSNLQYTYTNRTICFFIFATFKIVLLFQHVYLYTCGMKKTSKKKITERK